MIKKCKCCEVKIYGNNKYCSNCACFIQELKKKVNYYKNKLEGMNKLMFGKKMSCQGDYNHKENKLRGHFSLQTKLAYEKGYTQAKQEGASCQDCKCKASIRLCPACLEIFKQDTEKEVLGEVIKITNKINKVIQKGMDGLCTEFDEDDKFYNILVDIQEEIQELEELK